MEAYEYYEKETGKLYYKEAALELELTDDYINWLERNVVKLFAIPAVSNHVVCDKCNDTGVIWSSDKLSARTCDCK